MSSGVYPVGVAGLLAKRKLPMGGFPPKQLTLRAVLRTFAAKETWTGRGKPPAAGLYEGTTGYVVPGVEPENQGEAALGLASW